MDLGVHTPPLYDRSFDEAVSFLAERGVRAVEPGVGGNPGDDHLDRRRLLEDDDERAALTDLLDDHGMYLSALATHNNPLHPDEDRAATADRELREAITLADHLDVQAVTTFSGLPAGSSDGSVPNWITAPWPPEHSAALEYQWEKAIGYWSEIADHAAAHDVDVAVEMHPNMLVYEPEGAIRLREATGDRIGTNFDPSHLYWQGIDVTTAIRYLGEYDAISHVHAKDTGIYPDRKDRKGVLDNTPYPDEPERSWIFRTVGYGHGAVHWKDVVSTLRMVGYDGAISIEHEDSLMSSIEGLEKAIEFLSPIILESEEGDAYWAE